MLSNERQQEVLRHLRVRGHGNVIDLAEAIGVSPSTIRRDLKEMDEQGLLTRVHGGASAIAGDLNELEGAHIKREYENVEQKHRIGLAAAAFVPDHSTILITGGTTTEAMLPGLPGREGLTVITNGLNVAAHLSHCPEITVVVLGGVLRHAEMSLLGALAEQAIAEFQVDVAFIGAYGVDPVFGLSGASVHESNTDRRLIRGIPTLVALVDSTKFAQSGPVKLADWEQVSALITDADAPAQSVTRLRASGVDVRLV